MPPTVAIPYGVLYSTIALLAAAVVVLCGLWIKSHDNHRQWSTVQIHEHGKSIALLEHDYLGIREDLAEIKMLLGEHTRNELRIHEALIRKLDLQIEGP